MTNNKVAFVCKFAEVPRSLRMAKILVNAGYSVDMIQWDRMGLKPRLERKDGIVFKRLSLKSPYGLRSLYLLPVWIIYAFIQLAIGNYQVIQPQNLDCMVPSFFSTRLVKRSRIIYDLADFYRDAYLLGVPILSPIASGLEKLLIRGSNALILSSERAVVQVEARNFPKKVMMFYNAPDIDFETVINGDGDFSGRDEFGNAFTILFTGLLNYDRVKPLMNVIKAVRSFPVKIVVAGFGEYEELLKRLSQTNKQVVFLGYLSHKRALELTGRADLMLLTYDPSYVNNRIGLPNKLFEAMAYGCLILAPRNTYMGEFALREKIGIVVDYNDLSEIRRTIKSFIDGGRKSYLLSREDARKLYFEKFNPKKMNAYYLQAVDSLSE